MDFITVIKKEYRRACRIQKKDPDEAQRIFILIRDALNKVIADSVNAISAEDLPKATKIVSKQYPIHNN